MKEGTSNDLTKPKLVYIASAYSSYENKDEAVMAQITAANAILDMGHIPFSPLALHHPMNIARPRDYEIFLQADLETIRRCDAVMRLPGPSAGADREVALAKECEIEVFHDLNDLLNTFGARLWIDNNFLYAFRTEMAGDRRGAEQLIEEMKYTIMSHRVEEDAPGYYLDVFVVKSTVGDVEALRQRMQSLVENDTRFVDLHRCWQTLDKGAEPKDPFAD